MGCLRRLFKSALVEFQHRGRRRFGRHRRGFQDFVVKRNGHFLFVQIRAKEDVEARPADDGLGRGSSLQWIEQRLRRELDLSDEETAAQWQILKRSEVNHARSVEGVQTVSRPELPAALVTKCQSVLVSLTPPLLVNCPNVLAVEVHQSAPNSDDLSFDLELIGIRTP